MIKHLIHCFALHLALRRIIEINILNVAGFILPYTANGAVMAVHLDAQRSLILQHRFLNKITEDLLCAIAYLLRLCRCQRTLVGSVKAIRIIRTADRRVRYEIHRQISEQCDGISPIIHVVVFYVVINTIAVIRPIGTDRILIDLYALLSKHGGERNRPAALICSLRFRL